MSHIGDGNVHFIVHFKHDQWADLENPKAVTSKIMEKVHDVVDELNGTFSAEHGIGRKLTAELNRRTDPVRMEMMCSLRDLLDPKRIMNPGNVVL